MSSPLDVAEIRAAWLNVAAGFIRVADTLRPHRQVRDTSRAVYALAADLTTLGSALADYDDHMKRLLPTSPTDVVEYPEER